MKSLALLPLAVQRILVTTGLFLVLSCLFFLLIGQSPWPIWVDMVVSAFGDGYAWSETLVKMTPILLSALAVVLPARLGLISVGGEGQLYIGALTGTAVVLGFIHSPGWILLPLMLLGGALGGAVWAGIPAFFKAKLGMNETMSTLMLNYVAVLGVRFVVYGPWKDPANLGWPATANFPDAAKLPVGGETRLHLGLGIGIAAALILHGLVTYSRWGVILRVLKSNRAVGIQSGLSYGRQVMIVMAIAGMLAGLAGITETAMIQGRLQMGISNGYGLSGFLVAWLAGQDFLRVLPISLLIGALLASGDALQLFAKLPSSMALILQGLLFVCVLAVEGRLKKAGSQSDPS